METNNKSERTPTITLAGPWDGGTHLLRTLGDNLISYNYPKKEFVYKEIEDRLPSVQAFRDLLSQLYSLDDRKTIIKDEFKRWNEEYPDLEFAAWLIEQYKVAEINWKRDQWKLKQATKGGQKSWEEIVKERDERICSLELQLKEKDAIIALKTKEHDEYVANHSFDSDDGTKWLMKVGGKDVFLTLREYTIILYSIFRTSTKSTKLTANQKRLIGSYNTIDTYINQLKKGGANPLTQQEKEHVKQVLICEKIFDKEILEDYL